MKLSTAEFEIMDVIWQREPPVTSADIMAALGAQKGWKLPTVLTFLSRLCDKGVLLTEKTGKQRSYTAALGREAYKAQQTHELLQELYGGSVQNMVACMADAKGVSGEELAALRAWLEARDDT